MSGSVAIVHDWLTSMRGGERVLEALCALYPDADLFTLRYDPDGVSPALARHRVRASFVDRLARAPLVRGRFRGFLPLFPLAVESFRLDSYDLVISSSHCVALGALAPPGALHVAYVHSPMRYAWEGEAEYASRVPGGALGRWAFAGLARYLRSWDARAAARPDVLIANSPYTRARIARNYGRDAEVLEPPIDTRRFERAAAAGAVEARADDDEAPLLMVSALVPYKRVELAVRALAGRPERLLIVGEGPDRARLERLAGPNVRFLGRVDDVELDRLYAGCRALLHPAIDDFGMVMVEALAAGKPVVACREGGAGDIVRDGETGVLAEAPTEGGVRAALDAFARLRPRFHAERLRAEARRFDRAVFERRFRELVERAVPRRVPARAAAPAGSHATPAPLEVVL
jgi:glycosyltransferase involved in cell wall biosynthesis